MHPLRPSLSLNQPVSILKKRSSVNPKFTHPTSKAMQDHHIWRQEFLEKREDNDQRKQKGAHLLNDLNLCIAVIDAPNTSLTKSEFSKLVLNGLSIAENILAYYSIHIDIIGYSTTDSAVSVTAVKDNECLLRLLHDLIPKICSFPYSFLTCVGIKSISFCEDISLVSSKHAEFYNNKLYNGIFPIKQLTSPDKIYHHLYKVMMYKLLKSNQEFATKWRESHVNSIATHSKTPRANKEHNDLSKIFSALLEARDGKTSDIIPDLKGKVFELQKILREFDPAGVNIEWEGQNVEEEKENNVVFLTLNNPKSA